MKTSWGQLPLGSLPPGSETPWEISRPAAAAMLPASELESLPPQSRSGTIEPSVRFIDV